MNKTPSIFVNTGFPVDQNGALTEIDVPGVVTTLNAPQKVTFAGTTLNYIPSDKSVLAELHAVKCVTIPQNIITDYSNLTTLNIPSVTAAVINGDAAKWISNCPLLSSLSLDALQSISSSGTSYPTVFNLLPALTTLNLRNVVTIAATAGRIVANMASLTEAHLDKLQTVTGNAPVFNAITTLLNVTLGSDGHPVASLTSNTFSGCTQSGLTITIYTQGGAALSGSPWGATNATIVYEEA